MPKCKSKEHLQQMINKGTSKISSKTVKARELKSTLGKPKSINQGITKVNKLHKMASDIKSGEKKAAKKDEAGKEEEKKKLSEKSKNQNEQSKKWDLDF